MPNTATANETADDRYRELVSKLAAGADVSLDEVLAVLRRAKKTAEQLGTDVDAAADSDSP
jgi:hypothetical protein